MFPLSNLPHSFLAPVHLTTAQLHARLIRPTHHLISPCFAKIVATLLRLRTLSGLLLATSCFIVLYKLQLVAKEVDELAPDNTESLHLLSIAFNQHKLDHLRIGIVIPVGNSNTEEYSRALTSVKCYAQIHGYTLLIENAENYTDVCQQTHIYFRRHCMVAQLLPKFDYLMMLDADIGVLNPKRKIEDYIDPAYDILFYERFFNDEVAMGSYIVKYTSYSRQFLLGFAEIENALPDSYHGMDNGVLHKYIASKVFPDRPDVYEPCIRVYNRSRNHLDLFTYEACIRSILGAYETFPHIKILRKATGWVRDSWLANSMWNPDRDFMFHGWKRRYLVDYTEAQLPFRPTHYNDVDWVDPFIGDFDQDKCLPGNTTWNYDTNMISTSGDIERALVAYRTVVERQHYRYLRRVAKFL